MADGVFIDTWGWLALGHRKDAHHREVEELYREWRQTGVRIYTTDYVLDETITLLFRREVLAEAVRFIEGIFASAVKGLVFIERITPARFTEAWKLRTGYKDKPKISFTDLTSFTVMKELEVPRVMTEDEHFLHVGLGFERVP